MTGSTIPRIQVTELLNAVQIREDHSHAGNRDHRQWDGPFCCTNRPTKYTRRRATGQALSKGPVLPNSFQRKEQFALLINQGSLILAVAVVAESRYRPAKEAGPAIATRVHLTSPDHQYNVRVVRVQLGDSWASTSNHLFRKGRVPVDLG